LLIQTWCGDLDSYRGNTQTSEETGSTETTEVEEKQFSDELKVIQARRKLTALTANLIYWPQNTKNYTEESIKEGFNKLGFDVNIQNMMWDEYCHFMKTYIK